MIRVLHTAAPPDIRTWLQDGTCSGVLPDAGFLKNLQKPIDTQPVDLVHYTITAGGSNRAIAPVLYVYCYYPDFRHQVMRNPD